MTNTRKAFEMAIEALEDAQKSLDGQFSCGNCYTNVIQACKEALEQPAQEATVRKSQTVQEPVAFTNVDELSELKSGMTTCYMYKEAIAKDDIALYTHPAPSCKCEECGMKYCESGDMTTKDEALLMAVEALAMDNDCECGGSNKIVSALVDALQACEEALEQPVMTYEQGFSHGYEAHRVEQELEQPAQEPVAFTFVKERK